eukprot:SAG31_NODE_2979_length_4829_cov_6.315645_4_plen_75_part_00
MLALLLQLELNVVCLHLTDRHQGTYDTPMREMIESWQPKFHVHTIDSLMDVPEIKDGLPKFTAGPGSPLFEGTA